MKAIISFHPQQLDCLLLVTQASLLAFSMDVVGVSQEHQICRITCTPFPSYEHQHNS